MRLYNPKSGKEIEKEQKKKKHRSNFVTFLVLFSILLAIGGLVCCIVFKVKWYYYLVDIIGGFILLIIVSCFYPKKTVEYVDIPIEESVDEYIKRSLSELTPEKTMSGVKRSAGQSEWQGNPYKGIWKGIAVCECSRIYGLKNITYDITGRSRSSTSDDNGNMQFYETASIKINCRCSECGKTSEHMFYDVKNSTGSLKRKQEWFSDRTTVTTTSREVDYAGFVENQYNEDIAQYKKDCKRYQEIIERKIDELRRNFKYKQEKERRQIEELRAKGWYEKNS
ncbi:MAG: hypothetical protein K2G44_03125 [Clostridia bacterium]|nr:hypothetical protein [Clostridia bacterium]